MTDIDVLKAEWIDEGKAAGENIRQVTWDFASDAVHEPDLKVIWSDAWDLAWIDALADAWECEEDAMLKTVMGTAWKNAWTAAWEAIGEHVKVHGEAIGWMKTQKEKNDD